MVLFISGKRNPAVVDLGWAVGLTLMGLLHNLSGHNVSQVNILAGALVLLAWGLRLGGYLFWTRLRLGKKDARYESLQQKQTIPAPLFFLVHYLIQAGFQTAVGSRVYFYGPKHIVSSNLHPHRAGVMVRWLWRVRLRPTLNCIGSGDHPENQGKVVSGWFVELFTAPQLFF